MRATLSVIGLMLASLSAAQITISLADMPSAGDTLPYRTTQALGLSVDLTGAGLIWDYSALQHQMVDTDVARAVTSTPLAYQFYFNNGILYPEHQASYAMEGEDVEFQVMNITNVFEFFKKDASGHRNVGFGANVNGLPNSVRRQPVDHIYRFPLQFGDVDSSFSTWAIDLPTLFYVSQEQWRYNTVDGWGTLYLPADTFEVLRVRSVLDRRDSIFASQFGNGFAFNEPQTIEYKWLAQGMGHPVLTLTTVAGEPVMARYYSSEPLDVGFRSLLPANISIRPIPADQSMRVELPEGEYGILKVLDASGRMVREITVGAVTVLDIGTGDLPSGMYSLSMDTPGHNWRGRFMVQH